MDLPSQSWLALAMDFFMQLPEEPTAFRNEKLQIEW